MTFLLFQYGSYYIVYSTKFEFLRFDISFFVKTFKSDFQLCIFNFHCCFIYAFFRTNPFPPPSGIYTHSFLISNSYLTFSRNFFIKKALWSCGFHSRHSSERSEFDSSHCWLIFHSFNRLIEGKWKAIFQPGWKRRAGTFGLACVGMLVMEF